MKYPTNPDKANQSWYMEDDNLEHQERVVIDAKTCRTISKGVFELTPDTSKSPASARINVRTTNPKAFDEETQLKIAKDWQNMATKGYMVGPEDFRNWEATIYYKVTHIDDKDEMSIYGRGGKHPSGGFPGNCTSCCYKLQVRTDGTARFAKEYHHANSPDGYVFSDDNPKWGDPKFSIGSVLNKIIGMKAIVYDVKLPDGKIGVKLETYVDVQSQGDRTKKQDWKLINEVIDEGTLPDPKDKGHIKACKAVPHQILQWGGPSVTFRIDNCTVEVQKASVREIIAK
jgi:hypothetical protein